MLYNRAAFFSIESMNKSVKKIVGVKITYDYLAVDSGSPLRNSYTESSFLE